MDLMEKNKNIVFNAIVIIVAIIISYNLIYKNGVKNKTQLVNTKEEEIKKNVLLERIIQSETKIKMFKDAVNKKDLSNILKRLSTIAKDSSVEVISLKPQNEKEYPDYTEYLYSLTISAPSYHQIGQFISRLENSPDFYIINNLALRPEAMQIARNKEESRGVRLSANLTLSTITIK